MAFRYIYNVNEISIDLICTLAAELWAIRREKGISIDEAAAQTGLSVSEIDAAERTGKEINFLHISKLLEFYGISLRSYDLRQLDGFDPEIRKKYFTAKEAV